MARRPTTPQTEPDRHLAGDELKLALGRLDKLVQSVEQYDPAAATESGQHIRHSLGVKIEDTLATILGQNTSRYQRFVAAGELADWRGVEISTFDQGGDREQKAQQAYKQGKDLALGFLKELREILADELEVMQPGATKPTAQTQISMGFEVIAQRGRLDLSDPPLEGPYRTNNLPQNDQAQFQVIKNQLTDLVDMVRGDNSVLGETLRQQMVTLLRTTLAELEAPYADTGRVKAAIKTFGNFVAEAAKRGVSSMITTKVQVLITALETWLKTLL